jgi:F0F1-type ATP synthase membrane subunit b/b'
MPRSQPPVNSKSAAQAANSQSDAVPVTAVPVTVQSPGSHSVSSQNVVFPKRQLFQVESVDIQQELNQLEEIILDSPRIPLTGKTLISEEDVLDQIDLIRLKVPSAFQEAQRVLANRDEILREAEDYGRQIIAASEQRANELLDELGIVRQAELEAQQIRQRVQQDCEDLRDQVMAEAELLRSQARQDFDNLQRQALTERDEIQRGADDYADRVLGDMEKQLGDASRIIRNGRQQINSESIERQRTEVRQRTDLR